MLQKQNRGLSISVYILALCVSDTMVLLLGKVCFQEFNKFLNSYFFYIFIVLLSFAAFGAIIIAFVPDKSSILTCYVYNFLLFSCLLLSALLIVSMTFDRFYSIIRPHRALAVNTVKRAKIMIAILTLFSFSFSIPHFYESSLDDVRCTTFEKHKNTWYGQTYYWLAMVVNFFFPFVALLIMNSFIINVIRMRQMSDLGSVSGPKNLQSMNSSQRKWLSSSTSTQSVFATGSSQTISGQPGTEVFGTSVEGEQSGQGKENIQVERDTSNKSLGPLKKRLSKKSSQSNVHGTKTSEKQIYAILLLVTFTFVALNTPVYAMFIFQTVNTSYFKTSQIYADYFLLYSIARALFYTNSGINFFLYVLSGHKFRTDLKRLFKGRK